ncbi:hypothetical protein COW36_08295 [bacterium (Candidatus Blackallbacteria) CG17_big_fil_post_rev_8_21_14_2_50_48_46]|uniref:Uncharacterized protein n=1 Tax=bacterium (Candidatus Blackallbacteria) CG17_big_fil_post_rev_8_21_14_2_50_48_46 TaxID=2014261 RepID=A0A2M7G636_9BACT|nr:MAG: hypothetical protein COW64_24835 [bacterium (Candidatus Blackallbacteria) CG18_big_fil_WC_8_21_14_2_50_49_26]PIW17490.1 MAG: hypothetical protein COW36_08295 [bacterium (Candidatus Blackallbacteria) CG17_big_fil_post_rev_8_21_14_2_50_48_46]PIW48344.1 MAG: hypothetical protein COW20_09650 [bacterium (Candidatus Blackallbacteria) CG13_big_fil_rev_8_21_14_2_50_49_14]
MKNWGAFIFSLAILAQLSSPDLVLAMDKNQKKALSRAEKIEQQLAKDLAKYTPEQLRTNINSQNNYMILYKGMQRKIKELDEKLASLPADDSQVQALIQEAEKLKNLAEDLRKIVEGKQAQKEAQVEATNAYFQSEEAEKDKKILDRIEKSLDYASEFEISTEKHLYHYTDHAIEEARELTQEYLKAEQDLDAMIKKRDGLGIKHRTVEEFAQDLQEGQKWLKEIRSKGAELLKPLQSAAETALMKAASTKNYQSLSDFSSESSRMIRRVQVSGEIIMAIKPEASAEVKNLIQALKKKQSDLIAGMASEIIAANRFAADSYSGQDAGSLKNFVQSQWKSQFKQDSLLKVRLSSDWQRTTRWQWNESARSWDWKDYSVMHGHVLVKHEKDQAVSYYVRIIKRHTQNNQLDLAWDRNTHLSPTQIYLLKNIK